MHKETKQTSREAFSGRVFTVTVDSVTLENGDTATREVVHHTGGAAVLAFNAEGRIAMVRQFRYAAGRELYEIPAGKIEPGEPPRATALRELGEEVGCAAGVFVPFGSVLPTCAYCTEVIYLFLARALSPVGQHLDHDEFLSAEWADFDEVLAMVLDGRITDSKTVAAIARYKLLRDAGALPEGFD